MIELKAYPMMDEPEVAAMLALLDERRPARVLEWGSGGSTLFWPEQFPETDWWTVEHDPRYAQALEGRLPENVTMLQLRYPDYHELQPSIGRFDLIIVDGRKRVRCLDIARDLLMPGGAVILHDAGRERYAPARDYYRTVTELHPPKAGKDPRGLWLFEDPRPTRVFGIGLSRTGTTSLASALARLGYAAKHYPHPQRVMASADAHEALTDTPVIAHLEALDRRYPGALFILTTREQGAWLESCRRHWKQATPTELGLWNRRQVFGISSFDARVFARVYATHHDRIRNYFQDRPEKLLEMDIAGGDGYDKLCPAVGLPVLTDKFPHRISK